MLYVVAVLHAKLQELRKAMRMNSPQDEAETYRNLEKALIPSFDGHMVCVGSSVALKMLTNGQKQVCRRICDRISVYQAFQENDAD